MRVTHVAFVTVIMVHFFACKPLSEEQTSDTKSISELSGGLDQLKAKDGCSGIYNHEFAIQQSKTSDPSLYQAFMQNITFEANRDVALKNLSAIPYKMLNRFLSYGYRLNFVKDIETACSKKRAQPLSSVVENRSKLETCVIETFDKQEQNLEVNILATSSAIKNNTVLAIVGIVGERFDRVQHESQGFVASTEETQASLDLKEALALQLLHEGLSSGKETFALLKPVLPKMEALWAKSSSLEQRQKAFRDHFRPKPDHAKFLLGDVFANVGDSFYCNQATKGYLKQSFKETYAIWNESVHVDFQSQAAGAGLTAPTAEESVGDAPGEEVEEGFGLWRYRRAGRFRPYRRFQPARNLVRARLNQMDRNQRMTGWRRPRLAGFRRPWDGSRSWVRPARWGSGRRLGWRFRR